MLAIPDIAFAADVRVMTRPDSIGPIRSSAPAFERASGHHLITTRGPSMGNSPEAIPTRLARGEAADIVILDGGAADALATRGLVRADSKVTLAHSLIGMVVREGSCEAGHRQRRSLQERAACRKIDRLFGQRQRHLSVDLSCLQGSALPIRCCPRAARFAGRHRANRSLPSFPAARRRSVSSK